MEPKQFFLSVLLRNS